MSENQTTLNNVEDVVLDFLDFAKVKTLDELQDKYVRLDGIADLIYNYVTKDDVALDSFCDPKSKKVKRVHADGSTEWICVKRKKKPHHKGKKRGAMSMEQKNKISKALLKRAKRGL